MHFLWHWNILFHQEKRKPEDICKYIVCAKLNEPLQPINVSSEILVNWGYGIKSQWVTHFINFHQSFRQKWKKNVFTWRWLSMNSYVVYVYSYILMNLWPQHTHTHTHTRVREQSQSQMLIHKHLWSLKSRCRCSCPKYCMVLVLLAGMREEGGRQIVSVWKTDCLRSDWNCDFR